MTLPAQSGATDKATRQSRDRSLVSSLAWSTSARWGVQLVSWATTVVVARLLTPEDYGIVGMAMVYLGFITILTEFGIGTTIIALRDLDEDQVAQVNGLAIGFGLVAFLLSVVLAVPIGRFFRAPELALVVVVMSATIVIKSFEAVPLALLQRELQFRRLALVELIQGVTLSATMLLLAFLGFRYWTLVLGGIVSAALSTGMVLALKTHRIAWPRLSKIRAAVTYSWHIIVGRTSWYVYSNTDFLVAGRFLGKSALGAYSFAWTLASMPVDKITALVVRVAQAYFSSVQDSPSELRRYLLRLTEGIAILTFPASLGMAIVADPFVRVVLGDQWLAAVAPLQLLALYASFRSVVALPPLVLNVTGDTSLTMRVGIASAVILTAAFVVGSHWGTVGIALVWILVYPPLTIPLYLRLGHRCGLTVRAYLKALWPAASSAVLMVAAVLAAHFLAKGWSASLQLAVQAAVGVLTYGFAVLIFHRGRLLALRETMHSGRVAGAPSSPGQHLNAIATTDLNNAVAADHLRNTSVPEISVGDSEHMVPPRNDRPTRLMGWLRFARAHPVVSPAVWGWQWRKRFRSSVTIPKAATRDRLLAGAEWLARAQDASSDHGIARAYGLIWVPYLGARGWQPAYPETTGYIIPTLYEIARRLNRPDFAERATRAARWELGLQLPGGGIPGGVVGQSALPALFNTGQVLLGWMSAIEETGGREFVAPAIRAATFLSSALDSQGHWSEGQGAFSQDGIVLYNARTAWALAVTGVRFDRADFRDAAQRNLRAVVAQQHDNGWLPQCCLSDNRRPLLHTLAYAARGLIEGGFVLEDERLVGAGTRVAAVLAEQMAPDGRMAGRFTAQWQPGASWSCLTGQVQMANVWTRLAEVTGDRSWLAPAEAATAFVARTQRLRDLDLGVRGGIMGTFPASGAYGRYEVLSWATKFFCDALMRLEDAESGRSASRSFVLA